MIIWKGLVVCDAFFCLSHTLQIALESGLKASIRQIDFSAAFDRVTHDLIIHTFCSVGIGGSVLSIFSQFPMGRTERRDREKTNG